MRIALISTACVPVPPKRYGGTELVIAELAASLVALGHEVTTFAPGDSAPAGVLRAAIPRSVWPPDPYMDLVVAQSACRDLVCGLARADVVHVHTPAALAYAPFMNAPVVYTVHHAAAGNLDTWYESLCDVHFVMISEDQRRLHPRLPSSVVHHGIDPEQYQLGEGHRGDLAYLGRLAAEKAPHLAIDAARKAGVGLRLAGLPHPSDHAYHESELVHRLKLPGIDWQGEANHESKQELLGGARALLFPICWDEPFGLVMIESMLCGTPVIAFRRGSVPEVIEDGVTGFIVDDCEGMVAAIARLDSLDRRLVRERAIARWSATRMAMDYLDIYGKAIELAAGRPGARADHSRPGRIRDRAAPSSTR